MSRRIVIIGAGMGGLTAALRLARRGFSVRVIEARAQPGGLASSVEVDGFRFDAGPYILLDRKGLEWAFDAAGVALEEHVRLRPIEHIYEVLSGGGERVRFDASLSETAAAFDRRWPGSGDRYKYFVRSVLGVYQRLQPLLYLSHPSLADVARLSSPSSIPFLLRSLNSILSRAGLPSPIKEAVAIWTHVAGQNVNEAPGPMAFVPALIHTIGAYYPEGGIGSIPQALAAAAERSAVEFQFETRIKRIRCKDGRVIGLQTETGEFITADAVISNHHGIGTYLDLVDETPDRLRDKLNRVRLQSPGMVAYLAVKKRPDPPYLRFYLPPDGENCRLLVTPSTLMPDLSLNGWFPARLIAPLEHETAERWGASGQRDHLARVLDEDWWKPSAGEYRILKTRVPAEWGAEFHLYRDSMNPVMTARLMRAGRLPHRSRHIRGLYLAGSSTHPGQWVSFCAISGVLAANAVCEDLG